MLKPVISIPMLNIHMTICIHIFFFLHEYYIEAWASYKLSTKSFNRHLFIHIMLCSIYIQFNLSSMYELHVLVLIYFSINGMAYKQINTVQPLI